MAIPNVQQKQYTIDEYEALIARPENSDRRFELIDGELYEKLPTEEHGLITSLLITYLGQHILTNKLGRLVNEVRYRPAGDRHNDRVPDISFTTTEHLQEIVTQGAAEQLPDLVIEVQSPSLNLMRRKADYFLANGVRVVLLVLPRKQLVEVYRKSSSGDLPDIDILTKDDTLDNLDVLPGFSLPVKAIFEG